MKNIKVNILDPKSVDKAIKELNKYKKEVEQKTIALAQRLASLGADIVRIKIVSLGAIDTGELLSSVDGFFDSSTNTGYIRVTSDHAAFVEFGTGVQGDPKYPNAEYLAKASWEYAIGENIFATGDGKIGWFYPTDDGGVRFTEGMMPRPFMYNTVVELERQYMQIAKEVFGK